MVQSYKTIRKSAEAQFVEKHSRFIGYIAPVTTVRQANEFIASIKSKHWDATHNVPAYILREGNLKRYSDDGEPQGTAGVPVLSALEKAGLTDCVCVVTRYFGGTLLGTGGLVRAYSHAASIAVEAGGVVTRALCKKMKIKCDYGFYGRLSPMIIEAGGVIENTQFEDNVIIDFYIASDLSEKLSADIIEASNGKFSAEITGEEFADID
ncbi:MAG: YigZ family protein [Clostridia bacterium]|nr:YigZ family protein [Clostridia bacterium]